MSIPRVSARLQRWPRRPGRRFIRAAALALALLPAPARATWSIVAVDPQTREVGVAGASCVEGVIQIAGLVPGRGAVAAQASSNLMARDRAVVRLGQGLAPAAILDEITGAAFDAMAARRQYGLAAFSGPPAGFTGAGTSPWAGHALGADVSVQGNILVSERVAADALAAFQQPARCGLRLADRLMAALEAGAGQGGDSRCDFSKTAISAFLLVAGPDDRAPGLDLEALSPDGDATNPVTDLRAQYDRWRASHSGAPCDAGAASSGDGSAPPVPAPGRGCALGGADGSGAWVLVLLAGLLGRRRGSSCARGRGDATLGIAMRAGGLAVVLGLGLACSLRNLDDLASGSAPAPDAAAPGGQGGGSGGSGGEPPSGKALFWVDSGDRSVHSTTIDGSDARKLLTSPAPSFLRSIAVDGTHGKLYFTDSGLKKLQRANLDGSAMEDLVTGLDAPVGLDLDVPGGKVYFADQGTRPAIFRANLDGSGKEAILTAGIMHPYGLVLDHVGGRVYFVDNGVHALFRANLDGSAAEKLPIADVTDPIELALDPQGGKLYWSDIAMPPRIRRANLDGSATEDVITQARISSLSTPLGVAVDVLARKLYWVDGGTAGLRVIQRAELDGSGVHPVVVGLSAPRGLTIGY